MFDYKKIAIAGFLNYAVIFLATSIMMFSLGMAGLIFNMVTWLVVALSVYLIAERYCFAKRPKKPFHEGLMFGIGMAVVSIVLDIPVMVYGFAATVGWAWFFQWELTVGYLVMIAVPILVAMSKKK